MKIIISNNSDIPIYEQIKLQIIKQILNNELIENEILPSIRLLAQDIKISVMTVKKAYDELEQEGYIVTRQGKGSYVASKNLELIREEQQKQIEDYLTKIIDILQSSDIKKEEVIELFNYLYGDDKNEECN